MSKSNCCSLPCDEFSKRFVKALARESKVPQYAITLRAIGLLEQHWKKNTGLTPQQIIKRWGAKK